MRIIADLHIHSKYARACSPKLTPENLGVWAGKKGIGLLGTGDFTHPGWMRDLDAVLDEIEAGLYKLRGQADDVRFMFTSELASIYKQGEKVRRVHNLVFAPSMDVAKKFSQALEKRGVNVKADGRPIMGVHCNDLVKIAKDIDEGMEIIPAHAWTPHFGVFGSLSGFNTLQEAFGDQTKYIFAIETGLSSDPAMNWRVAGLDSISLISNSDPHSLHRLGREANIFEVNSKKLSYAEVIRIIKNKNPQEFISTIEFFPEEGKYHLDGHRDCKFSCEPSRTKQLGGVCPVCGKQLLRGVLNRVDELADREIGQLLPRAIPYKSVVPLEEIIADVLDVGVASKKVQLKYEHALAGFTEFDILLSLNEQDLLKLLDVEVAAAVLRVREGLVKLVAGYDGEYGHVGVTSNDVSKKHGQRSLF